MNKCKAPMRLRREGLKLSRREMSERIGVSTSALTKWERNEKNPGLDSYIKLASFFKIELMHLKNEHDDWRTL